jgi:MFS family permease
VVAAAYQIFKLTDSSLQVGLLSAGQVIPIILCSFLGGALADAMDRRKLLIVANVLMAATSAGLALNAMVGTHIWVIYVCTALSAGLSSIDSPTRSAAVPMLVRRDQIPASAALNQICYQVGSIVGPSIAGLIIAGIAVSAAYWLDVATFAIAFVLLLMMRPLPPEGGGTRADLRSVREGLGYLKRQKAVQGCFLIDINAMVFGMPRALFPQLGTEVFGGTAATVGFLYAAPGVGAFLGALTTGWVGGVRHQGRAVLYAVIAWGVAIIGFGLTAWLPLAMLFLAIAGAADVISAVFRGTIIQLQVPDRLRGRLNAINIAVVTGGPRIGDLEAGVVASLTSAQFSVVSGGVMCVAGVAVINKLLPELGSWHAPVVAPT